MKLMTLSLILAVLAVGLLGCSTKDGAKQVAWTEVAEADLTPSQEQQLQRALEARKVLFSRLSAELKNTMEKVGPVKAISVCKDAAPRIAYAVSEEQGLKIGRTSFKLRNPANAAPAWAEPIVKKRVSHPVYLAGPAGELGVLLPIRAQGACLTCHGGEEDIPSEVRAAVANLYPDDHASGFAPGDLRGWFWVEVDS